MFARVSTYQGATGRGDDARRAVEQMAEQVRTLSGFQKGYFLVDRTSGKGMSITLWESESAMQSSAGTVSPLRSRLAQSLGSSGEPSVETYEVVGEI